jgi:hypothetical protein
MTAKRLNALLDFLKKANTFGGDVELTNEEGTRTTLGLADSFLVLREHRGSVWILYKQAWFQEGPQLAHTHKMIDARIENDTLVLDDDRGRQLRIYPTESPEQWEQWQEFKTKNPGVARYAERLFDEHAEMAYNWEG